MPRPKPTEWEIQQRFWSKVTHVPETGCLVWTGGLAANGYGQFKVRVGKMVKAHRFAWAISGGKVPEGHILCHTCEVRTCVNTDHLYTKINDTVMPKGKRNGTYVRAAGPGI